MTAPERPRSLTPDVGSSGAESSQHAADGHLLVGQLGSEVAAALSSALECVNALATTGKISRKGLRQLRDDIELAKRTGIMGQQVQRLASGRVRQTAERVDLTAALRDALVQHRRRALARGIEVHQALGPAQVMADPTLVFTLIEALLEWSVEHARSTVEFRIELDARPAIARIRCGFGCVDPSATPSPALHIGPSSLHSMSWRLLEQTAHTMDLPLRLDEAGGTAHVTIEFPRTVSDPARDPASPHDRSDTERMALNSKPLAGSHVLVIAARRESRAIVRDALRHMGLMIDYVASVEEASEFCDGGLPHAVLHESSLGGERFERLRKELLTDMPHLVFIELRDEGLGVTSRQVGQRTFSLVSLADAVESLPPTLMFELSQPR